jgi:hypothetical protein
MTLSFHLRRLGAPPDQPVCHNTEKTILLVDQDQIFKNIIPTLIRRPLEVGEVVSISVALKPTSKASSACYVT